MNTRIMALACTLCATACGSAETRRAQDPTSANSTVAPSGPTAVTNAATDSTADPPQTKAGADMASTTGGGDHSASATNRQPNPSANAAPPGAAPVAENPGFVDQTKNADNTKINARDRHGALTPMDQSNSSSDIKITAAIRKGIMGDKTLSFTAKNVKIITIGNKVTLRGPVKSDQEKAAIEALAKQTTGVNELDDQLEVKK